MLADRLRAHQLPEDPPPPLEPPPPEELLELELELELEPELDPELEESSEPEPEEPLPIRKMKNATMEQNGRTTTQAIAPLRNMLKKPSTR